VILSALLLAAAPTRIALIGAEASNAPALTSLLGANYVVRGFTSDSADAKKFAPNVVIFSAEMERGAYRDGDAFVPTVERQLTAITNWPSHPRVLLVQPIANPFSANFTVSQTVTIPLLRQAARETGVAILIPDEDSPAAHVEAISDAVADPKVSKRDWKLVSSDSEQIDEGPAKNAIDGDPDTYWHTQYDPTTTKHPHQLIVDLGHDQLIGGFRYVPRQDGGVNGRVKKYEFWISQDGQTWAGPVAAGEFANTADPSSVKLKPAVRARYFKFVALSEVNGQPYATAAEIDVLRATGN
jgi:hypothetical protein